MPGKIAAQAAEIIILQTVGSTNNYAMGMVRGQASERVQAWQALSQTEGRGRMGRRWFQQPGDGLAISIVLPAKVIPGSGLVGLNLLISLCVQRCVEQWLGLIQLVKLKWPNDVMIGDRKAGGILIETSFRGAKLQYVVAGIGVNLNGVVHSGDERNRAVSLQMVTGRETSVQDAGQQLYATILEMLDDNPSLDSLIEAYNQRLHRLDEWVSYRLQKGGLAEGACLGIDTEGRLQLKDSEGGLHRFHHHEVERVG